MSEQALELSRAQKAAAIMVSVGTDRAAGVLKHLEDEEVEQLAGEIAALGSVPGPQMRAILEEFRTEAEAHRQLLHGGEQHARDMLRRLRGDEADEIVDRLLASSQAAPFHFVRMHDPDEVLQHLRDEHPQTVALVLAHLPARLGAQLLSGLDVDVQSDVANRLATLERADPEVVRHVERALRNRLGEVRRRSGRRDGIQELADVLNQTDRATERKILAELEETDPELAEKVRALMFVFEDLGTLPDEAIQRVLREVRPERLALALKGVSAELRGRLEENVSERVKTQIAEEMDLLGAVRVREVEEAQTEVVQAVHELERQGEIELVRAGEEEFVA